MGASSPYPNSLASMFLEGSSLGNKRQTPAPNIAGPKPRKTPAKLHTFHAHAMAPACHPPFGQPHGWSESGRLPVVSPSVGTRCMVDGSGSRWNDHLHRSPRCFLASSLEAIAHSVGGHCKALPRIQPCHIEFSRCPMSIHSTEVANVVTDRWWQFLGEPPDVYQRGVDSEPEVTGVSVQILSTPCDFVTFVASCY